MKLISLTCVISCSASITALSTQALGGGCTQWQAGPLATTSQTNGLGDSLTCVCTWDPDGGGPLQPLLVVAGDFSAGAGISAGISTYNAFTNTWQQIGSCGIGNPPRFLLSVQNNLVAGGHTSAITPGASNWDLARYDGSAWQHMGSFNDPVECGTVMNGSLAVGTKYDIVGWGGYELPPVRVWTPPDTWSVPGYCYPLEIDDVVHAIGYLNGNIVADVRRFGTPNLKRWNRCQYLGYYGYTNVMQEFNGSLYLGGSGGPHAGISRYDIGMVWPVGAGFQYNTGNGEVFALAVHNGELYAGGRFTHSGGLPVSNIARWNGSTWQPLGSGINGDVKGMASYNGALYVVGDFSTAGAIPCNNIARWSNNLWSAVQTGISFNSVMAMANFDGKVIATGQFQQMTSGGAQALNIMAWDGVASSPLGSGLNDRAMALESFTYPGPDGASELIAAGRFTNAGGVAATRIARWVVDPAQTSPPLWAPMGAGFNWDVQALERFNGQTYAAGFFSASGAAPLGYIARWNEATDVWEPLLSGLNDGAFALKAYNGFLYVGGLFTTAGGVATGGLARWNGSAWSQVGGNFNGIVTALEVHNNELVIGGSYPGINSSPNLAKYNGSTYSTFGTGGTNDFVWSLTSLNGQLYVGGAFNTIGGVPAKKLSVWNGSSWAEVQGGTLSTSNRVYALSGYHNEVHAGGTFLSVNNATMPSPGWARFQTTGTPWIHTQPSATRTIECQHDFNASVQVAAGYDGATFQWRRNSVPLADGSTPHGSTISGAATALLTVADARSADAGTYDCLITSACGNVTSTACALVVEHCCPPDINQDGQVNVTDLLAVISAWGTCAIPPCAADINSDSQINVTDLLAVIGGWGACP